MTNWMKDTITAMILIFAGLFAIYIYQAYAQPWIVLIIGIVLIIVGVLATIRQFF